MYSQTVTDDGPTVVVIGVATATLTVQVTAGTVVVVEVTEVVVVEVDTEDVVVGEVGTVASNAAVSLAYSEQRPLEDISACILEGCISTYTLQLSIAAYV